MKRFPCVVLYMVLALTGTSASFGAGWTVFTPSADSLIVYVSSTGNDGSGHAYLPSDPAIGADPFHPAGAVLPYRTLAAAKSQLRNAKPDWMLLRRGDTWTETLGNWTKSGRGALEPMLVGAYGSATARPRLLTGNSGAFQTFSNDATPVNYLALAGLYLEAHARQLNVAGPVGIQWLAPTDGALVEVCFLTSYGMNMVFQPYPSGQIKNVQVRRTVSVDAWNIEPLSHAHGLYADGVDTMLVEECIFDHNGWSETIPGAGSTIYSHNIYMQNGASNITFRGNIISNAGNHGLQMRHGGVAQDNLFFRNVVALLLGGGDSPTPGGVQATATGNVILEGYGAQHFPAGGGWGIDLKNVASGLIQGNILANTAAAAPNAFSIGTYVSGGPVGIGVNNTQIRENVVYNWRAPIALATSCSGISIQSNVVQDPSAATLLPLVSPYSTSPSVVTFSANSYFSARPAAQWFSVGGVVHSFSWWTSNVCPSAVQQQVTYPDPGRTMGTYASTLGLAGTSGAFITEARKQSKTFWRPEYTAAAAISYVREGFGQSTGCPADLDNDGVVDSQDQLNLLAHWGQAGGPADIDGNGIVGTGDYVGLLASWGPCP